MFYIWFSPHETNSFILPCTILGLPDKVGSKVLNKFSVLVSSLFTKVVLSCMNFLR